MSEQRVSPNFFFKISLVWGNHELILVVSYDDIFPLDAPLPLSLMISPGDVKLEKTPTTLQPPTKQERNVLQAPSAPMIIMILKRKLQFLA